MKLAYENKEKELIQSESINTWRRCKCGNYAEHERMCEVLHEDDYENGDWMYDASGCVYQVLKCPSCSGITIVSHSYYFLSVDNPSYQPDDTNEHKKTEVLFESYSTKSEKLHLSIPKGIREVFMQAKLVVESSARASLVLCRAVLEEICRERGISDTIPDKNGNNIYEKLELLFVKEKGKLSSELCQVIEEVCRNKGDKKRKPRTYNLHQKLELLFKKEKEKIPLELRNIIMGIKEIGNEGAHGSQNFLTEHVALGEVEILIGAVNIVLQRLYVDKAIEIKTNQEIMELKNKLALSRGGLI